MNQKLYVGNLSFSATENELIDLFSQYGAVSDANLIVDTYTQKPRGFAFVTMSSAEEAQKAVEGLNGVDFMGRNLTVNEARPKGERSEHRPHGNGNGRRSFDRDHDRGGRSFRR